MPSPVHLVRVTGLPPWLDVAQLLGPDSWTLESAPDGSLTATAHVTGEAAADVGARLRGLGVGGQPLIVDIQPALTRRQVRAARTEEARRMRRSTPGFTRSAARAEGEGRYSLTPEALAVALGRRVRGEAVVDACAGAGGNTLGFARAGCTVTALERDPARLSELRHNLAVYGVQHRVAVVAGDLRESLAGLEGDLLFADPPWGERYDRLRCARCDIPLLEPLLAARGRFGRTWLKLPPSFDVAELPCSRVEAVFGDAPGDGRRVKFLLVEL